MSNLVDIVGRGPSSQFKFVDFNKNNIDDEDFYFFKKDCNI